MAKTIQVTPDIAAIYVKYIKKNCNPKENDMFDLLDSEGNIVKMFYGNILHIAKQSQHEHNKREIEGLTISAEMQLSEIKERAKQVLETIEPISYQIEEIKRLSERMLNKQVPTVQDMARSKEISTRLYYCLKSKEIRTIQDIIYFSEQDMISIRNFGKQTLSELKDLMNKYKINFKAI